jgi:hypothetical protein
MELFFRKLFPLFISSLHELTIFQHSMLYVGFVLYRQREIREVCIHPGGTENITPFKHQHQKSVEMGGGGVVKARELPETMRCILRGNLCWSKGRYKQSKWK